MEIRNNNNNNNNHTFGAKLGSSAKYYLKNTPEKLEKINKQIANFGEPTTVVDIMSTQTKKGKKYSLRIYNEIFGTQYNVSMLKDRFNKDVTSFFAKDFLTALGNITETNLAFSQYTLFSKIKELNSGSLMHIKNLFETIKLAESEGKYLSEKTKRDFFSNFR